MHYVLTEADGLGEGFIMQWLEGEALGARIARAPEFEAVRQNLAFECGQIMARIHQHRSRPRPACVSDWRAHRPNTS